MASAPETVTEMRSGKLNIHSAVPPITPSMAGLPAGGAIRKWALTMARKSSGTVRSGTSSPATQGGTASTTASCRSTGWTASPVSSAMTWR